MTNPTSRVRGTGLPASHKPGTTTVTKAFGLKHLLELRTRHESGSPAAHLADLVLDTAREADRLAEELRRHADHARERLDSVLVDVTAARYAQQMQHLGAVLATYRALGSETPQPATQGAGSVPPGAASAAARHVSYGPLPAAGRRRVGRCPCVCNSGGFCGGCGHAGCGGR
ncbi:hypothetical protein [Actinacidiphila oryziradicis]|uniref:Uncharacterized protein n=1 Tax=Actinacidiphila oryziradicis TaxID=2571141 RepID=A0A4U0RV86_9ACTN|nr:hypothetical protein [Actinacidiphila oryziradicis]TKA00100.1 hypothetical protein FCI23_43510 [Actinacidiphila oryziradicis]